jgi:hypothetical protein
MDLSDTQSFDPEGVSILPRSYYLKYDGITGSHRPGRIFLTKPGSPGSETSDQPSPSLLIEDAPSTGFPFGRPSNNAVSTSATPQTSPDTVFYFTKGSKNTVVLYEPAPPGNEWSAIGSSRRLVTIVPDGWRSAMVWDRAHK